MTTTASAPSQTAAISVRQLEKSYGATGVLRGLELDAHYGEALTLFGANGAGKTTLLRILSTLTRPDAGEIRVNGLDLRKQGELVRHEIGVVMHSPMLYGDLTARENLRFFARMHRVTKPDDRIGALSEKLELGNRLDIRVRHMSHGQQKRVALARALLHAPRILLLDEPESGLDQRARRLLEDVINGYRASGRCVVMTTHELERGLELGDRIAIINRGRVVFEQSRGEMDAAAVREAYSRYVEDGG